MSIVNSSWHVIIQYSLLSISRQYIKYCLLFLLLFPLLSRNITSPPAISTYLSDLDLRPLRLLSSLSHILFFTSTDVLSTILPSLPSTLPTCPRYHHQLYHLLGVFTISSLFEFPTSITLISTPISSSLLRRQTHLSLQNASSLRLQIHHIHYYCLFSVSFVDPSWSF